MEYTKQQIIELLQSNVVKVTFSGNKAPVICTLQDTIDGVSHSPAPPVLNGTAPNRKTEQTVRVWNVNENRWAGFEVDDVITVEIV